MLNIPQLVQDHIGTAYDEVKTVSDNIDKVVTVSNSIASGGLAAAEGHANAAASSANAAATSAANAGISETNAGISETNAANSANAASISEGNVASSVIAANASATNALNSANAAALSETNAAISAAASASVAGSGSGIFVGVSPTVDGVLLAKESGVRDPTTTRDYPSIITNFTTVSMDATADQTRAMTWASIRNQEQAALIIAGYTEIRDMAWSDDGAYLYLMGVKATWDGILVIWQFRAGTAWDMTTLDLYDHLSIDTTLNFTTSYPGICFSAGGRYLYLPIGQSGAAGLGREIWQYELMRKDQISSAVLFGKLAFGAAWSVSTMRITVSSNGEHVYVSDTVPNVYQLDLSIPWDIRSAVASNTKLGIAGVGNSRGLHIDADGDTMFFYGYGSSALHEVDLSTPYNIATATHRVSYSTGLSSLFGGHMKSDGTAVWINDLSFSGLIYRWDIIVA